MGQIKILGAAFAALLIVGCIGCASTKPLHSDLGGFATSEKADVTALEMGNPAIRQVGYSVPGSPMKLPSKSIRIYIPPSLSPLGRLIGEHYVWATIQPETYWTPGSSGLNVSMPDDVYYSKKEQEPKPVKDNPGGIYASGPSGSSPLASGGD